MAGRLLQHDACFYLPVFTFREEQRRGDELEEDKGRKKEEDNQQKRNRASDSFSEECYKCLRKNKTKTVQDRNSKMRHDRFFCEYKCMHLNTTDQRLVDYPNQASDV